MCEIGDLAYVTNMLRSYWGGMIAEGATTFWETYDPNMNGAEHYGMYGRPYGKSLCHAWGATTPLYIFGKYILGVRPTDANYASFEVQPCTQTLGLGAFSGVVPTPHGDIKVCVGKRSVKVLSELSGGKLVVGGKTYEIEKDKEICIEI